MGDHFYGLLFHGYFIFAQAVTAMVQQAMQYIDQTPDIESKIELIKTLNNVSAGKVNSYIYKFQLILCWTMFFFVLSFLVNYICIIM